MQKDESQDAGASGLPGSPLEKAASSGGFELGGKLVRPSRALKGDLIAHGDNNLFVEG